MVFAVLVIVAGVGVAIIRFRGGPAGGGWGVDDQVGGSIAIGAVLVGLGVVDLMARRRRPLLLVATGAALIPMCIVSVVLFPLALLAAFMIGAGASAPTPKVPRQQPRTGLTVCLVAALHVSAMASLIVHPDPRTIVTPAMTSSTSDVITWFEVVLSLGCTALAILVARTMPTDEPVTGPAHGSQATTPSAASPR